MDPQVTQFETRKDRRVAPTNRVGRPMLPGPELPKVALTVRRPKEATVTSNRTISVATAVAFCAVALAGTASAGNYPPAASKAMGERYEAMADHYLGVSTTAYSPRAVTALGDRYEAMADHYLGVSGPRYPPQALRALGERWEAAARYDQQAQLEQARRQAAAFDWVDAGIGALAATGVVALLGLGALGLRSRTPGRPASPAVS